MAHGTMWGSLSEDPFICPICAAARQEALGGAVALHRCHDLFFDQAHGLVACDCEDEHA